MVNYKTKIAFLCGSKAWGGLEMNHLKNALWFQEFGLDVVILCKEEAPIKQHATKKHLTCIVISEHRRYKYFQAGLRLAKTIIENQITHIIARDSKDLNICSIAKTFSKQKIHLSYFMEMQLGVSKRNFLHTARYRKIDVWFCPLNYLKNQVLKHTRFPENKIVVLPSAIEIKKQKISKKVCRENLALPLDAFVCGIVGRIDEHKGQLEVIKALSELNLSNWKLCIVGSPTVNESNSYFDEINKFIFEHQLSERVLLIAHQEDVNTIYPAFDVSIMASKSETFGMVTLEALANGIPVIGTNSGGTPELLENGKFGTLYPYGNKEMLQEAILDFYNKKCTFNQEELIHHAENFAYQKIIPKMLDNLL